MREHLKFTVTVNLPTIYRREEKTYSCPFPTFLFSHTFPACNRFFMLFLVNNKKVLLGEVNAGLSTTQVVVKELKASASVQEQMQFLEEVQPYR